MAPPVHFHGLRDFIINRAPSGEPWRHIAKLNPAVIAGTQKKNWIPSYISDLPGFSISIGDIFDKVFYSNDDTEETIDYDLSDIPEQRLFYAGAAQQSIHWDLSREIVSGDCQCDFSIQHGWQGYSERWLQRKVWRNIYSVGQRHLCPYILDSDPFFGWSLSTPFSFSYLSAANSKKKKCKKDSISLFESKISLNEAYLDKDTFLNRNITPLYSDSGFGFDIRFTGQNIDFYDCNNVYFITDSSIEKSYDEMSENERMGYYAFFSHDARTMAGYANSIANYDMLVGDIAMFPGDIYVGYLNRIGRCKTNYNTGTVTVTASNWSTYYDDITETIYDFLKKPSDFVDWSYVENINPDDHDSKPIYGTCVVAGLLPFAGTISFYVLLVTNEYATKRRFRRWQSSDYIQGSAFNKTNKTKLYSTWRNNGINGTWY